MRLRYIVPTLGLAVFSTLTASAAQTTDSGLKFSGWVDTIFAVSDDDTDDAAGTAKDEEKLSLGFDAIANLKATWTATNEITAKVNLWFFPDYNDLQLRDAFFEYTVNPEVTVRMGKFVNPIGWISTEPVGLWRVRTSTIGYNNIYGNDVIGAAVSYAPKDSMVSGSLAVTNGYFSGSDAQNRDSLWPGNPSTGTSANRENDAVGLGLDVLIQPSKELVVDIDVAYDIGSDGTTAGNTVGAGDVGGDVLLLGINAEYKVSDALSVAGEVMNISADDSDAAGGGSVSDSGADRTQGLVAAKYALAGTSFPMAVSGMVQMIQATSESAGGDVDTDSVEVAAALLTNPLAVSNFGLNYEFAWNSSEVDAPGSALDTDSDGWALSVEGIVTY